MHGQWHALVGVQRDAWASRPMWECRVACGHAQHAFVARSGRSLLWWCQQHGRWRSGPVVAKAMAGSPWWQQGQQRVAWR